MLKLVGPKRTRTMRVIWLLEELGEDYDLTENMPHSEEVTALNRLRQVPVLISGETVLTDSLAICHWLTDRDGRLTYPPGSDERAVMDARINFVLTELEAPLWMATRHSFILPEDRRRPDIMPALAADFADAEEKFAGLLGDAEYFGGDAFTIADIFACHCTGWALAQDFGHRTSAMADYHQRISARPALKRAREKA